MLARGWSGCRLVTRRARASPRPLPAWTLCRARSTAPPPPEEEEAPPPPPEPTFGEKLRGVAGFAPPPRPPLRQVLLTGATSFAGIGALSVLHFGVTAGSDFTLLLGSFGATAVLVFGAPAVPFSQPRNVVGGHLLAAAAGVAAQQLLTLPMGTPALAAPVAVSAAIMLMASTGTLHPPAGGTAHSSKERRRPLFWRPFSAVTEPPPGLLVPLSGILASRRRKPRKNEKKRGKNGRDMA